MYLILPLLLIRLLSAAAAETDTGQPPDESVQALVEWLTAGGAYLAAVRVGVGEAGYRGVLAATHINKGEVILRIPLNKAINTGPMSITASEAAVKLLRETHKKRATRRAYVGALPPRSECTTLDGWDQKSLAHLPAALVAAALQRQKWATKVFDRDVKGKQKLFGGQEISWEEFVHATCLVSSRTLGVSNSNGDTQKFLLPYIDLINHDAERGPQNSVRLGAEPGAEARGPTSVELVAGRALAEGEEVYISYAQGANHNWGPDEMLAHYGFIERSSSSGGSSDGSETAAVADGERPGLPLCGAHAGKLDLLSLRGKTVRGMELHAEIKRLAALEQEAQAKQQQLAAAEAQTDADLDAGLRTRRLQLTKEYWAECLSRLQAAMARLRAREHIGATTTGRPQDHHGNEL